MVLLRGSNHDTRADGSPGSDSNGSGKTCLAMATLWGLTGSMDPRPVSGSDVSASDVIHLSPAQPLRNGPSVARVTVRGQTRDGLVFEVTRERGARSGPQLYFRLGDRDLTCQAVKDTQAVMEATLGFSAPLLQRCCFLGQHALHPLLQSTDAQLKDELGHIVAVEVAPRPIARFFSFSHSLCISRALLLVRFPSSFLVFLCFTCRKGVGPRPAHGSRTAPTGSRRRASPRG